MQPMPDPCSPAEPQRGCLPSLTRWSLGCGGIKKRWSFCSWRQNLLVALYMRGVLVPSYGFFIPVHLPGPEHHTAPAVLSLCSSIRADHSIHYGKTSLFWLWILPPVQPQALHMPERAAAFHLGQSSMFLAVVSIFTWLTVAIHRNSSHLWK